MNTDTPETDNHEADRDAMQTRASFDYFSTLELCRKLERERDRLAEALEQCREDSVELLGERDWWQNETRIDYQKRYRGTRDNIDRADAVLQSLNPNELSNQ